MKRCKDCDGMGIYFEKHTDELITCYTCAGVGGYETDDDDEEDDE